MPSGGRRRNAWTKTTRPKSPGRPKGAKDKVPRSFKGSIKAIFEEVATEQPELIHAAVVKGLKASAPKSFQYLQLMTAYIDGKPSEAYSADEVRHAFAQVGLLFVQLVADIALRERFFQGVKQLVGEAQVMDAQPVHPK